MEDDERFGFIVMDGSGTLYGTVQVSTTKTNTDHRETLWRDGWRVRGAGGGAGTELGPFGGRSEARLRGLGSGEGKRTRDVGRSAEMTQWGRSGGSCYLSVCSRATTVRSCTSSRWTCPRSTGEVGSRPSDSHVCVWRSDTTTSGRCDSQPRMARQSGQEGARQGDSSEAPESRVKQG